MMTTRPLPLTFFLIITALLSQLVFSEESAMAQNPVPVKYIPKTLSQRPESGNRPADIQRTTQSQNITFAGQFGGATYAVAVQANLIYAGVGPRLVILNASDPYHPVPVGQTGVMPDIVKGISVVGNYAYVADSSGGFRVINVADPTNPIEVGSNVAVGGNAVTVVGNYAYVAGYSLGIVDISNPANPIKVSSYQMPGYALGIAVSGGFAYVADGNKGLRIISIANPTAPYEVGYFLGGGWVQGIAVYGNYAYVTDGYRLRIVNVSNPASPAQIAFYELASGAQGVAVSGNYAYVVGTGLHVINVANPANLTEVGSCNTPKFAYGLAMLGNYAYVANRTGGVGVINVSNLSSPIQVGYYDIPGNTEGIAISGDRAYVSDGKNGLKVLDILNPISPSLLGSYSVPGNLPGDAHNVVVGNYAYLADRDRGLRIIDISQASNPTEIGYYSNGGDIYDIAISGNYGYVIDSSAAGSYVLRVLNLANPAAPVQVGFLGLPSSAVGITVAGSYAYVADGPSGLRIIDVSNPSFLTEVGHYDIPGWAQDVSVVGNYAYVADYSYGLRIISISNPLAPIQVSDIGNMGSVMVVEVIGQYAYIGYGKRIGIVDISNPLNPLLASYSNNLTQNIYGLTVAGNYIYVADNEGGIFILAFATTYSISGRVVDGNNNAVASVTVSDGVGHTTTTDSNGNYTLAGLVSTTYTITPSKSGYSFSPAFLSITVSGNVTGKNFTATLTTYAISGRVTDGSNNGIPDVTVSAGIGHVGITDPNGNYNISGLAPGTYTITPSKSGYTFSPASRNVTVPPSGTDQNFTGTGAAAWTLMFYLDGNNTLDSYYPEIVKQLQSRASNPNVQVLVLWKRRYTKNAIYCKITPSDDCKSGTNYFPQGNLNMASPTTLVNFVSWVRANYPAQHYALILDNHGNGLGGGMLDDDYGGPCFDDLLHPLVDCMRVPGIGAALGTLWLSSHSPIDVLYISACDMAMIEDAYQFRTFVSYYVASQNPQWSDATPYAQYVAGIQANSTPAQVASLFVNSYADVEKNIPNHPYTMSAADLSQLNNLVAATNSLAQALNSKMPASALQLMAVRGSVQIFDSDGSGSLGLMDSYVDLYDFARVVKANFADSAIQVAGQSVMEAVTAYIPPGSERHGSTAVMNLDHSHGVSIFFPAIASSFYNVNNYDFAVGATWPRNPTLKSRVAQDTISWGPMLASYFQATQPGGPDDPNLPTPLPKWGILSYIYLPLIKK